MKESENLQPLPLPDQGMWSSIDVVVGHEIHGGHQSRLFAAEQNGERVVIKLVDGRLVDDAFHRRMGVTALLAETDDTVVGPIAIGEALVVDLNGWLVAVYRHVEGSSPAIDSEADVRRMAMTMADLHRSMDRLSPVDLPLVVALLGAEPLTDAFESSRQQLLHGDFSWKNLLISDRHVRVIDFDDCGYGPIEFEVGNTLYMVLFDSAMSSDMQRYERFRSWFVDEYRSASGSGVPDELIDKSIGLRIQALERWIDRPEAAPIGIRTATPAWRDSLRAFVQEQTSR